MTYKPSTNINAYRLANLNPAIRMKLFQTTEVRVGMCGVMAPAFIRFYDSGAIKQAL